MIAPSGFRSSVCLVVLVGLLGGLFGQALPAAAESLWTARSGSLVIDTRASRAGDIVTIIIDEQSSGDKNAETKLGRDSSVASSGTATAVQPKWLKNLIENFNLTATGKSDYDGKAQTTRTDKATGQIAAKVMRVLENGHLLVEGRRLVGVQGESQVLVVSGIIRPQDIQPDNTVRSAAMADAEVRIEGKGTVSDRQKPGLFQRVFDFLGLY